MTRQRGGFVTLVEGHSTRRHGQGGSPLPYTAAGVPVVGRVLGEGYARCSCGELSPGPLPSGNARGRWHTRHKEEVARAPWSDAVIAERYS